MPTGPHLRRDAPMSEQQNAEQHAPHLPLAPITQAAQDLVGIVAVRDYKVAMLLGGRNRWRTEGGYTFLPLELPGSAIPPDATPTSQATALARRALGCEAWLRSNGCSYGPSERHRIDHLETDEKPAPLVRVERLAPVESDDDADIPHLGRVLVRAYLVEFQGDPQPPPEAAGLLLLPLAALRQTIRGMPLADLLALKGVEFVTLTGNDETLPANALVYVSGEYGERHLLRAVAKYGPEILEG